MRYLLFVLFLINQKNKKSGINATPKIRTINRTPNYLKNYWFSLDSSEITFGKKASKILSVGKIFKFATSFINVKKFWAFAGMYRLKYGMWEIICREFTMPQTCYSAADRNMLITKVPTTTIFDPWLTVWVITIRVATAFLLFDS